MESHPRDEKCREVFSLLSQYLDLELPPEACAEIEAHVAGCPPCVEFAESLRKTVDLCRRHRSTEMPGPVGAEAREELMAAYRKMLAARRK